jgi:hypothetical protein
MVNITNSPPVTPVMPAGRTKASEVESHSDEHRANTHPKPFVERRKQPDRRRQSNPRPEGYEMRNSRGRRKTDRGDFGSVDVSA